MSRIIDLTDGSEGAAILDQTAVGGLLGSQLLREPLATHLGDEETARYVLRNKRRGVVVENPVDHETVEPAGDYQACCVLTDVHLHYVVGAPGGDRAQRVHLRDVVQARAERSGFRTTALHVETADGEVIRFPLRGDAEPVAAAVEDAAQPWATAVRRLEDVESALNDAREALAAGEPDRAGAALEGVEARLGQARTQLEGVGPGAVADLEPEVGAARETAEALRRRRAAAAGAAEHARAQAAWAERDYEAAAAAYDAARSAYADAGEYRGPEPAADQLRRRSEAAARERRVLRHAPVADADAARERARATDRPAVAAGAAEEAVDRIRTAIGLEWPGEGSFAVDRPTLREEAAAATAEAVEYRRAAGRRWLAAGDRIAARGKEAQARQAYERARPHIRRALEMARELLPERIDALAADLERTDERIAGRGRPAEADAVDAPLPVDSIEDAIAAMEAADRSVAGGGGESAPGGPEGVDGPATAAAGGPEGVDAAAAAGATAEAEATGAEDRATGVELAEWLRGLDRGAVTDLVAEVWAARGWSTTRFAGTDSDVYDVVAVRDGEEAERLLLWVVHDTAGGAVGPGIVDRVLATLSRSEGGDRAVVVTTGRPTRAAREAARDGPVTVVGPEDLAEILREEELTDIVPVEP